MEEEYASGEDGSGSASAASSNESATEDMYMDRTLVVGQGHAKNRKSALKMYQSFAEELKLPRFEDIQHGLHTKEMVQKWVGFFTDYLIKNKKIGAGARSNYLSTIKTLFAQNGFEIRGDAYKNLRRQIGKSKKDDKKSCRKKSIGADNFLNLCRKLFADNTEVSLRDRGVLAYDWATIGRISEVTSLSISDVVMHVYANRFCLKVCRNMNCVCSYSTMFSVSSTGTEFLVTVLCLQL